LYQSKPSAIEAIQWRGDNHDDVVAFAPDKTKFQYFGPDSIEKGLWILAGKDGTQKWIPVPIGHWVAHPPDDLSDVWPIEEKYFEEKYEYLHG
jgi:hypothetical protein